MALATFTTSSPSVPLTDEQRADFARFCADTRSGNVKKINAATDQLKALPSERAQVLLLDLWQREEPQRRKWAVRHTVLVRAALWLCWMIIPLALLLTLGPFRTYGFTLPWHVFVMLLFFGNSLTPLVMFSASYTPKRTQRGALVCSWRYRMLPLAGLWIDALDFRGTWSSSPYRASIHAVLADLLSRYAASDAPPLDMYQQKILLREIKRFTGRLHKRDAVLNDAEFLFLAAAITYLSALHERQTDAVIVPLVHKLSTLPPNTNESPNRRLVREVANECLPLVPLGR